MTDITRLTRIRIGVRAVLTLAVFSSIAANVLHAHPDAIARTIAAWPPLALLLTVELISRVPVHAPWLAVSRLVATAAIAGIAAWVSYWHMVDVAYTHGESTDSAHLIPLSVDGLVVVTSICLVEIGARLRSVGVPVPVAPTADQSAGESTPTADQTVPPTVPPTATPTDTRTGEEAGTPDPDPTGTRRASEPVGSGAPPPDPVLTLVAGTPDDTALITRLRGDIKAGRLKADPGAEAIRKHLRVGNDRARRLRDQLQADSGPDEMEAARA